MVGFRLFWDKVRRYLVRNLPLARSLDWIGSDRIGQRNANEITAMTQKSHNRLRNKGLRTGKPNGHTLRSLARLLCAMDFVCTLLERPIID